MAGEKTEQATPKKKEEARNKGTIAKSQDLNGSVVLLVGIIALGITGPNIGEALGNGMRQTLSAASHPDVVQPNTVGTLMLDVLGPALLSMAPLIAACAIAGVIVNVAQVGIKLKKQAAKPDPQRLNPINGMKNLLSPNSLFEGGKGMFKVVVVGVVVVLALIPKIEETAGLVGISPIELAARISEQIRSISLRAVAIYLLIGAVDYIYQRKRVAKQLKMDKQEVKEEAKNADLPPEIKSAIRRKQMEASRARMLGDVPTADVIVTNPTHYAVALRYDQGSGAPIVVAKGMDHLAAKIREIATDSDVPLVPDPPLARSLHASVEVGHEIPEELFEAVAAVLAFVYRTAGRRSVA